MSCRRRLSGAPASPLEDENILSEILLRLPSRPSSLPRASLVCKRWRSLVSEPYFLRRFRDHHHRKPPLLGFFSHAKDSNIVFFSPLDPPDRIPTARFSLRLKEAGHFRIMGCRHGLVLFLNPTLLFFLVWDPITGDQRREAFPLEFCRKIDKHVVINGAVLCDEGYMHGGCHSNPFEVVMLGSSNESIISCVYSSKTGTWGNIISLLWPQNVHNISNIGPSVLVGDSIFWLLTGRRNFAILEFDLCRQSLACMEIPSDLSNLGTYMGYNFLIARAGGGLNLIVLSDFMARVWKWISGCNGWVLRNTIVDLSNHLSLRSASALYTTPPTIIGLVEDDNAMLLWTDVGIFVVHVESMQFKKLCKWSNRYGTLHPFTSFYSTGK